MTASWDANTDSYTAGYRIYYGTASGTYQWSLDVGNQTSAPLNLSPGNFFFAVRAYNASYEYGPPSSEATVSVGGSGGSGGSGGEGGGGGGGSATAPTATINATLASPTWAIVTWSTNNATSMTINGNAVGPSGSAGMAVSSPTTYTILARNTAGQTATANVTVGATGGGTTPPPTAWIGASLDSSNTAFVAWSSSNATSVTINGGPVAPSGSVKIPIYVTTTYTIVVRDDTGRTATSTATVIVP
jgi:hypothetical protein